MELEKTLEAILNEMFRRRLYFTMNSGKSSSVNGYGTTLLISAEITSKTDVCEKCDLGKDHTGRCSWKTMERSEFFGEYKSTNKMVEALHYWLTSNPNTKSYERVK